MYVTDSSALDEGHRGGMKESRLDYDLGMVWFGSVCRSLLLYLLLPVWQEVYKG